MEVKSYELRTFRSRLSQKAYLYNQIGDDCSTMNAFNNLSPSDSCKTSELIASGNGVPESESCGIIGFVSKKGNWA